jgi:hypothetical protein
MNNNNNTNRFNTPNGTRAHEMIDTFEEAQSPHELAAFFDGMRDALGMRASARLKDGVAGVMALGRYRDGDGGHVWASSEYERIGGLNVPKMKVLFDNMSQKTMGAVLVAIAMHHDKGKKATDLIKELVRVRGVSPNATLSSPFGEFSKVTALHFAYGREYPSRTSEIVKLLLELGANPNARDAEGRTPLHMERGAMPSKIKALLAAGANPNARDAEGRTPLFYHVGHPDCVKLLLRAGADPYAKDKKGDTPLRSILKRLAKIGGRSTPRTAMETVKILMAATNARPSNIGNIKIDNLPANIRNVVDARASLGVRRFGMTKKALNKRLNSNTRNIIMRQAFG